MKTLSPKEVEWLAFGHILKNTQLHSFLVAWEVGSHFLENSQRNNCRRAASPGGACTVCWSRTWVWTTASEGESGE